MKRYTWIFCLGISCSTTKEPQAESICGEESTNGHEILYHGRAYIEITGESLIIEDEDTWLVFQENLIFGTETDSLTRTDIDWNSEQIAIASAYVPSTCGLHPQLYESCIINDVHTLQLVVDDFSGSCDYACDAEDQVILIVAVPTGETNIQSTIIPTCKEEG